ncbi:chromatin assembly factor 1 subunit A-B-like [Macrobrachium nipponense]|uniref:chromatin assembly factor 1 subunit A-B-like n=1 Tax=Macrobrachium nipponense TaxID=159736 RepID=UPI0030C8A7E7
MSDDATVTANENDVGTPPAKKNRTSNVSRATAEGEALLKEMGFEDKETPGRRRTRAAIRGDVYTPPPKKERKATTPGTGRRGRPPKKAKEAEAEEEPEAKEEEKKKKKEDKAEKGEKAADEDKDEEADGEKAE